MPKLTIKQNNKRINDNVQSILINKFYPYHSVFRIIEELGYNSFGFEDDGGDYYRFRQFNPGSFRNRPCYKIIDSEQKSGVKFVIEYDCIRV